MLDASASECTSAASNFWALHENSCELGIHWELVYGTGQADRQTDRQTEFKCGANERGSASAVPSPLGHLCGVADGTPGRGSARSTGALPAMDASRWAIDDFCNQLKVDMRAAAAQLRAARDEE